MESQFNTCIKMLQYKFVKIYWVLYGYSTILVHGHMRHAPANQAQPEQRTHGRNLCPNSVPPAPTVLPVIHAPRGRLIKAFKAKVIHIYAHIKLD